MRRAGGMDGSCVGVFTLHYKNCARAPPPPPPPANQGQAPGAAQRGGPAAVRGPGVGGLDGGPVAAQPVVWTCNAAQHGVHARSRGSLHAWLSARVRLYARQGAWYGTRPAATPRRVRRRLAVPLLDLEPLGSLEPS